MRSSLLLCALAWTSVSAVFDSCPWDCPGTALDRRATAQEAVVQVDMSGDWADVRHALVRACGLKVEQSTSHCFEDFNHVDCCTMVDDNTHRTNEQSRVPGMHHVNLLGPHITRASNSAHGPGGSWCTCHLNSPFDVCHKQFGSSTAFKLVWCKGSTLAAVTDDSGNLLNWGRPRGDSNSVPGYGAAKARAQDWRVLESSPNATMTERWVAACEEAEANVARGRKPLLFDAAEEF